MRKFTTIALFVIALALAACGSADKGTGIKGQTFLAECEGDQIAVDCFSQEPYQATLVIYDESFQELARVQTEADGTFIYDLDPGTYYIHPFSPGQYPIANDFRVVVAEGERTELTIIYDSGAR